MFKPIVYKKKKRGKKSKAVKETSSTLTETGPTFPDTDFEKFMSSLVGGANTESSAHRKRGPTSAYNKIIDSHKGSAAAEKPLPENDFEKFITALNKQKTIKSQEEEEKESLIFKINKLRLEIETLKEIKDVQMLKKNNTLLQLEVLELKFNKMLEESPSISNSNSNRAYNTSSSSKDSINIKNVIYNNCSQSISETIKNSFSKENSDYDPNFTVIASQLLSFFSDKMDANFASHMDSIKQYTYQMFTNELEKKRVEQSVSPIKIKKIESEEPSEDLNPKYQVIDKHKNDSTTARKKVTKSSLLGLPESPSLSPPLSPGTSDNSDQSAHKSTKDLKFAFSEIKEKILDYLSGKVSDNMVITTFRRLQRSKAYSMLRQTFDTEHNRLLRVYLFEDGNILVQDMKICRNEFAKSMYHSVRYYAVILNTREEGQESSQVFEASAPKSDVQFVPPHCLRSSSKLDFVVLQPLHDSVERPRFKVDMVQDTMVNEEFVLVSKNPFNIRPIHSEVVLTSTQLELLKPLVLKALSTDVPKSMPIITIIPDSGNAEALKGFSEKSGTNLFILNNDETSENYKLSHITKVIGSHKSTSKQKSPVVAPAGRNKRVSPVTEMDVQSPQKKFKDIGDSEPMPPAMLDKMVSLVNVDDIIKGVTTVKEECIDLSDSESDEDTIIIN